ncbi:dehydrodolichyl diphosphate synthase complex subunit DHDDS [Eurytemora carolleeae]|uniref:dehydrodolichyl diphosphate synthase complex subunit DHDDS n=1 Tax=Eurytemora carolleeae TaxID=1294199 RepID=UPI000C78E0AF|nr:dehydrodolichyl diphosphate synthase complex subunit DHDDS [Eurytemora carolleeae]|eukprot:XP_023349223.1 dehydrodolichyl diphosphate synthase complex subunit DHDDS-like [Eurytemora affinis]
MQFRKFGCIMTWVREEYKFSLLERFLTNLLKSGSVPRHVAFIMDGNRRFARQQNMEKIKGHSEGFERLADTLQWCRYLGITTVTVYAFRFLNFYKMLKNIRLLISEEEKLKQHGVRVKIIGNMSYLPDDIQQLIAQAEQITELNSGSTLNVAFSYTAREEITQAVRRAVNKVQTSQIQSQDIDEKLIDGLLYTTPGDKVDLLVRTSGECRLSDFLLWQTSSSITYFTQVLWPEFDFWHLLAAVFYYQRNMFIMNSLLSSTSSNKQLCSSTRSRSSSREALQDAETRFTDAMEQICS